MSQQGEGGSIVTIVAQFYIIIKFGRLFAFPSQLKFERKEENYSRNRGNYLSDSEKKEKSEKREDDCSVYKTSLNRQCTVI